MAAPAPSYHPDIDLHPDVLIPVRDETVAATRYSPTGCTAPLPAILIATPYRKDDRITFGGWDPSIRYLALAGYEVVVMDLLGTGASTGTKTPFDGGEGDEVASVIEWLADREWTTGSVGTFGLSYGAWTQYQAAAVAPDALDAIVPVAVTPSVYQSSWTGGVFNALKRATWSSAMQAHRALPPSRRDPAGRWADVWETRLAELRASRPWLFQFLDHPTEDDFWADRRVAPSEITVPTFAACGYRDTHTGPMVKFFDRIDAPKRLVLGPWRHTFPERGREAAVDFRRQVVDWFDQYLKGDAPDRSDWPTIAYWTERDGGWTPGAGVWRGTDRWPTVGGDATVTFALSPGRLVHGETPVAELEREVVYDGTVGMESLARVGSIQHPGVDTSADDARSLSFETEPLDQPVELTGTAIATIRLRPETQDPLVAVRVVDVGPTGSARLVTAGYCRVSHRDGHQSPHPPEPGMDVCIDVPLTPKSHVFEAGRRIRVAVAGAAFPQALPVPGQGPFTVCSTPAAPSVLTFPGRVHPDDVALDRPLSMDPPDDRVVPVASPFVTELGADWETARTHTAGTATFRMRHAYAVRLPHGAVFRYDQETEADAQSDAPTAMAFSDETTLTLEYPHETVQAETHTTVTPAMQSIQTTVSVDDATVFDERWRR